MNSGLHRRVFIRRISIAAFLGTLLGGCTFREKNQGDEQTVPGPAGSSFQNKLTENRKLPRELLMQLLDQKVDQNMQLTHHCAQSSFLALMDQFGLQGDQVLKALTPMPGIAERGETCGAVTGPLMALGLIYGRGQGRLEDWDTYRNSLIPAGRFCDNFEKEFGTTLCHDIQRDEFGRCFHLTDPAELREFQDADATTHCSAVVRKGVRLAAEIILDDPDLF